MQLEELSYAKTVVNASYVSRRGSGPCSVRQIHPSRFHKDEANSLKVRQHLVQMAKEEKQHRNHKLDRSNSLDHGASKGSRMFEYRIDSNRMAEKAFDSSGGYHLEPNVIKPLALKPLVLNGGSDVSLSRAISSELFSSGSIPSNKEIDRLLEVIKTIRQNNCNGDESPGSRLRFRRHSDVSDLRNSKRSIKDPPSRSLTRSKSNATCSERRSSGQFASSRSAFKSIPRAGSGKHLHSRQCSQQTILEEDVTEAEHAGQPSNSVQVTSQRIDPVRSPPENNVRPKITLPSISKKDVPEKATLSSEENASPAPSEQDAPNFQVTAQRHYPALKMPPKIMLPSIPSRNVPEKPVLSSEDNASPTPLEPDVPITPPDNSLRTTPSPDNETNCVRPTKPVSRSRRPRASSTPSSSSNSFSSGFSVRNPARPNNNRPKSSGNSNCLTGPDDFVLQHALMRKARQRHRMCSQPCVGSSPKEDDGVEKLPSPRYSPNTHPRARLPATLAACSGNHPPVSYLNHFRRSASLQVNHIAMHEFRNLQRSNDNRLKYSDDKDLTLVTDRDFTSSDRSTDLPPLSEQDDQITPLPGICSDPLARPDLYCTRSTALIQAQVHSILPPKTNSTVPSTLQSERTHDAKSTTNRQPPAPRAIPRTRRHHSFDSGMARSASNGISERRADPLETCRPSRDVPTIQTCRPSSRQPSAPKLIPRPRRHHSFDSGAPGPTVGHVDEVKDLFKRVGRKYLSDRCVLPCAFPEIEKQNSLSFIFDGNKELQDRVRAFFQQTNKAYCKRLTRQRFASNPLDCTSDSSEIGDAERRGVRSLSEYADLINAHIQPGKVLSSTELNESLQAYLLKSESFVTNKCDNFNEKDKLTKADDFLEKLKAATTLPSESSKDVRPVIATPTVLPPTPTDPENAPPPPSCLPPGPNNLTALPLHPLVSSNTSDCSECPFKSSGSKTSRDSGYGDSTSASNEVLNPPKHERRNRSASLTILSKLKPLFGIRKREPVTLDESNPFNKIFEDHPISELTKAVDSFIARRASLPDPVRQPSVPEYDDDPVFDSDPSNNNLSPPPSSSLLDTQKALQHLDSAVSSGLMVTSLPEGSEDEEFRVSPLPHDEEGDDDVFYVERKSLEDVQQSGPANNDKFSLQDIQEILDSFDVIQQSAPASDKEYHKVHNMLQSKLTIALSSIYHTLSNATVPPNTAQYYAKGTLEDTLDYLDERLDVEEDNANILELVGLLDTFEDFIDLHDEIISRRYYDNETLPETKDVRSIGGGDNAAAANHSIYRMVGLHKNLGEPLGITLKKEDDRVVVHRILAGGMIDRQRLLHIGDVIIAINNQDVQPNPEHIQRMLKDQEGDIHLKIIPSYREQAPAGQVYVKAHFNYDPRTDNLIPCKEAGLKFNEGDILQIVNQDDPNWWQAKMEGIDGQAGLIPGLILQEQRMATKNEANKEKSSSIGCGGANRRRKKKNKKTNYSANKNSDFDQHELNLYEEVAKMPPFDRKTLVLIGAQGVGRRSLISKLVLNEPDKFGNTMPHTSRPIRAGEKDGCGYWFTTREKMDEDIANHKYLEFGEYEKHLYGTKLDSIRQVMRSGKMCLLDVNPQSLKVLKTSEFVPYVVFIEAPPFETLVKMHKESARDNPNKAFSENDLRKSIEESKTMKRKYSHFFDVIIQNNNMDETYNKLYECINKLSTSPQWVPVNWFY